MPLRKQETVALFETGWLTRKPVFPLDSVVEYLFCFLSQLSLAVQGALRHVAEHRSVAGADRASASILATSNAGCVLILACISELSAVNRVERALAARAATGPATPTARPKTSSQPAKRVFMRSLYAAAFLLPTGTCITTQQSPWEYKRYVTARDSLGRCKEMVYQNTETKYAYYSKSMGAAVCTEPGKDAIWQGTISTDEKKYTKLFKDGRTATLERRDDGTFIEQQKNASEQLLKTVEYDRYGRATEVTGKNSSFTYSYNNDGTYMKILKDEHQEVKVGALFGSDGVCKLIIFKSKRTIEIEYPSDGVPNGTYREENGSLIGRFKLDSEGRIEIIRYTNEECCIYRYNEDYATGTHLVEANGTCSVAKIVYYNSEYKNYATVTNAFNITYTEQVNGRCVASYTDKEGTKLCTVHFNRYRQPLEQSHTRNKNKIRYARTEENMYYGVICDAEGNVIGKIYYDSRGTPELIRWMTGHESRYIYDGVHCCTEEYLEPVEQAMHVTRYYYQDGYLLRSESTEGYTVYEYTESEEIVGTLRDYEEKLVKVDIYTKAGKHLKTFIGDKRVEYMYLPNTDIVVLYFDADTNRETKICRYDSQRRLIKTVVN